LYNSEYEKIKVTDDYNKMNYQTPDIGFRFNTYQQTSQQYRHILMLTPMGTGISSALRADSCFLSGIDTSQVTDELRIYPLNLITDNSNSYMSKMIIKY